MSSCGNDCLTPTLKLADDFTMGLCSKANLLAALTITVQPDLLSGTSMNLKDNIAGETVAAYLGTSA